MSTDFKKNLGFTLIETVIYIALLGLIMGGTLMATYGLLEGVGSLGSKTVVQGEGNFVLRKLSWAFSDMSVAPTVSGSGCIQTVSVSKTGYAKNPIEFQRNAASSSIEIHEGGSGAYLPLTTENVAVSCLQFQIIPPVGGAPAGVVASTTIDGINFAITKYLRK